MVHTKNNPSMNTRILSTISSSLSRKELARQDRRKPHTSSSHCTTGVDSGKLNNIAEQLDGAMQRCCCWKSEPNRAKPPFQYSTKRRGVSLPSTSTLWMMHGSKNADTVAYTSTLTDSRSSVKIFFLSICFDFNLLTTQFIQTR